ncbi:MAG: FecR family protein, partial [Anaerolineales bacterium]
QIRDLGTRFDVDHRPPGTVVAVFEGRVRLDDGGRVRDEPLGAGHRRVYSPSWGLGPAEPINIEAASAWQHGRLVFSQASLEAITAELGRYHPVRFIFAEPDLRFATLSGTFDTGDLEPFLRALEHALHLHAERGSDQTIVLRRVRGKRR